MNIKEQTWLEGVSFFVIATISVGAIMIIDKIWKAQEMVSETFKKLRNKMSSEEGKKETVQEEKKEAVILPVFNPQSLVSKGKDEAGKIAADNGFKTRVMREDSETFMGTMDYDTARLNLEIEKGLVVKVSKG